MRIKLFNALVIVGHFLQRKLGVPADVETPDHSLASGLQFSLAQDIKKAKEAGWITEDNYVLIEPLEQKLVKFVAMYPVINLPMGRLGLSVTAEELLNLLKEVKKKAEVEQQEVICLPFQK